MNEPSASDPNWHCPVPTDGSTDRVLLAHGEGGLLMRRLVAERILARLGEAAAVTLDDAARLPVLSGQPVITTDSFVVSPLFFPGGDIGKLAVWGTVNDLVVAGARPLWLTLALILEEGLEFATLDRVLESVREAAHGAGVRVVAGDTKVVPRGACDGLFINTTGLGELLDPAPAGPATLQVGDEVIVSGAIARHGIAVLAARESLLLAPMPASDCASLVEAFVALREHGVIYRAARDATRGGVAAVLHAWAQASGLTLEIDEAQVPVGHDVRGVCELLGLDPLHVACEGTFVLTVPAGQTGHALAALRTAGVSQGARAIGRVVQRGIAPVTVRRALGRHQPLDEPLGAMLPRIC